MTTVSPAMSEEAQRPLLDRRHESPWKRFGIALEERLIALADRANPILVKETRQALKSRQFIVTFLVVLIGCWIVSFVGVAWMGPQIYYAASGPAMLAAYYTILVVPLALVVPFTAFRSLAAEQEENTYELLSITTLGSRQIVTGKLASAAVQMAVYMSAVSPCVAFTFLLRGVDALTVGILLAIAALGSMGLAMTALLIGAAARVRNAQTVISVVLVLLLAWACMGLWAIGMGIIGGGSASYRNPNFWLAVFGVMAMYVATFGLLHAAAAAQIAFASENRSTPLRRWMTAQQACFCGWVAGACYVIGQSIGRNQTLAPPICVIGGALAAGYWYAMGTLMTGEWPHLSRRVQRSLPSSALGRGMLSLFNPGPGTGYLFAVANLTALTLAGLVWLLAVDSAAPSPVTREVAVYFLVLAWAYVVAFLGFGRLIINVIRRWVYVPLAAAFLLHMILLLSAIGVPTIIQMTSRELRNSGYTLWQMTNPIWTMAELADRGVSSVQGETLILIIPAAAVAALLLNMRSTATELLHHRAATPVRIIEEEAELHPAPAPQPSNPWEAAEA